MLFNRKTVSSRCSCKIVSNMMAGEQYAMEYYHHAIDDLSNLPYLTPVYNFQYFRSKVMGFFRKLRGRKFVKPAFVSVMLRTRSLRTYVILFLKGGTSSIYVENRLIVVSPSNDPYQSTFPSNRIVSNKYTVWNFVPKNLFEQFRRVANFYFLLTAIIAMSIESPISPVTSMFPLSFVILVTACKQGYEDYLRYRLDQRVNHRLVTVIRNKCMQDIHCEEIVVGDLVKVSRDEDVPCDMVLFHTTEDESTCFVTTSNLDGETNLKTLHVPKIISKMHCTQIVSMEASITCEHPQADLYTFHGKLEINTDTETPTSGYLCIDNLLLRGARLKDTEYVIGCAIYTGQDTKLSLNSKITTGKFSTAERTINKFLLVFISLLAVEVVIATIMKVSLNSVKSWSVYLGPGKENSFTSLLKDLLSFTILFNYIVPISLYVTIELQKFLGSFFFTWDIDMYDKVTDQPSIINTSDLNEELGQVEYLFTDKTGTLTENLMVFRRCSVNGQMYMEKDCDGNLYQLPPSGDEEQAMKLTTWQSDIWHFMISISLCHVVQIGPPHQRPSVVARRSVFRESFRLRRITTLNSSLLMHPDLPEYQAASADEKALVEACARCGVIFQRDSSDEMDIKIDDKILTFKKIEILEFSSARKRMSVVVKDAAGDMFLYCKGADSAVFPLIVKGKVEEAKAHVSDFSRRGLRTLVVAYKKLKLREYERLMQNVEHARQVIGPERGVFIERAYDLMESGLTLLGVTAVEDRLQEGVQETLESLRAAGIKVWVLTGDKAETAENIAFLCGHYKPGTEVLRLMEETTSQSCFLTLTSFERKIMLEPYKQYGLLVDGMSLAVAIVCCPELFKNVGMFCEAVVCCRLTPLQKSEIVQLIKSASGKPLTAAIGDGGNDVSMIQEAHVGIGIMGKEGRQATMCADFAFAKFMFLKKALLVHGHWYYARISVLTQYFFYKNVVFITPQVLFCVDNGFSTQALYDSIFLMCFNVLFSSLPVLIFGLFEQNQSALDLMRHPHLYKLYHRNYLMSWTQFVAWVMLALWHTCVIYYMSYIFLRTNPVSLYDNTPMDHWTFSTAILHLVTLITNIQILLRSSYWTVPFVASIALSIFVFFGFTMCYCLLHIRYDGDMLGVYQRLMMSPSFWLLTLVVSIGSLIPDVLIMIYNGHRPQRILRKNEENPEDRGSGRDIESVGQHSENMVNLLLPTFLPNEHRTATHVTKVVKIK